MRNHSPPCLTFAPKAWLKLQLLCHLGDTEVGGFGLSASDRPLHLKDVLLLKQTASPAFVSFDDDAVADLFDRMVDVQVPPARFARVWLHTHPGRSPHPSPTDEQTFARVFGRCDWAVMAILARGGATYARLRFGGGSVEIPTAVAWEDWPAAAAGLDECVAEWRREYEASVLRRPDPWLRIPKPSTAAEVSDPFGDAHLDPFEFVEEHDGRVFAGSA